MKTYTLTITIQTGKAIVLTKGDEYEIAGAVSGAVGLRAQSEVKAMTLAEHPFVPLLESPEKFAVIPTGAMMDACRSSRSGRKRM